MTNTGVVNHLLSHFALQYATFCQYSEQVWISQSLSPNLFFLSDSHNNSFNPHRENIVQAVSSLQLAVNNV